MFTFTQRWPKSRLRKIVSFDDGHGIIEFEVKILKNGLERGLQEISNSGWGTHGDEAPQLFSFYFNVPSIIMSTGTSLHIYTHDDIFNEKTF